MQSNGDKSMNIDENVQKVIKLLLRKWKLLILFMLIGALLAGVYTAKFTTLTYTSSVEFLTAAVQIPPCAAAPARSSPAPAVH